MRWSKTTELPDSHSRSQEEEEEEEMGKETSLPASQATVQ